MKLLRVTVFEPIKFVFQLLQASEHYFTELPSTVRPQIHSSPWKFDLSVLSRCHKVGLAFIVSGATPEIDGW